MKLFVIPDIHGCLGELTYVLSFIEFRMEADEKIIFLGDYIHGGEDSLGVLDCIINLQNKYGSERVVALLGNHEEWVLKGYSSIESIQADSFSDVDDRYLYWLENLPRFYQESNTIFVHAGIDESLGPDWDYTDDYTLTNKYPADIGKIEGLEFKVVAGHISTSEISGDDRFSEIYFDGYSHFYLDGDVLKNELNVMMIVTGEVEDEYYELRENSEYRIGKYEG